MNTEIIDEGGQANNKENHNKYDLQKFHQYDKAGTEQILHAYAMHKT